MAEPGDTLPDTGASVEDAYTTTEQTNGATHGDAAPTSKFHQALSTWRTLNLTTLISQLDVAAAELVSHQRDSLVQRKDLAQKTKDFRKLDDTDKLAEIKDLLRAYQGYIDVLTTHSKSVSAAFMQAYTPLSDAPDPVPLLEISLDGVVAVDEEVPALRKEKEAIARQLEKANAQIEETEKQLDEERNKREAADSDVGSQLKEVEQKWAAVVAEKEENWSAKEKSMEERIEHSDRLLKELKASYEVSQRLEKSGEKSEAGQSAATSAELEITTAELDRAQNRIADLESRNERLRVDLAQASSAGSGRTAIEDDPAYLRLRSENSSLLRKLDAARYDKEKEQSALDGKLRSLERDIASLRSDRENLTARVQKHADYDELKRELEMLRAVEFASVTTDDLDDAGGRQINGSTGKESLEQLLLARNKKLTSDLTELRVAHNEIQQRLEQLQEDLSGTNMDLEKTRNLNAQLENDLQKAQQEATNAFETMSVAGTYTTRPHNKSLYASSRRGGGTSPTSSIIGGFDPSSPTGTAPRVFDALRAGEPYGGGSGILPMVTAQRDRFKKKIGELEAELQKQYAAVSSLRTEVTSLQKDNLNLYEKTRYVSTYSRQPASSGSAYGGNSMTGATTMGSSGIDDRYKSAYEANISPFAAFRGRESARALKRMSLPERAVWQMMRFVLATRTSRNLFALYCVGLHLLVLVMLYYSGTMQVESHVGAAGVAGAVAGADNIAPAGGDWEQDAFEGS
ncbi:hypothetical protein AMS68_000986 [Peltaster fructicola]|uniref:Protein CASP n=1 Tax=Peltaster fructicola TaxID=286661 RepID=A0A6H0XLG8_9PEZI|nr:hypothetical protein AMS68_000986 [Peltaster fructicola]